MMAVQFEELEPQRRRLVEAAARVMQKAYAPYSDFRVGAAVSTKEENDIEGHARLYTGANMENASYGLSMCAEVSALTAANTAGELSHLEAIAVVGGPWSEAEKRVLPSGIVTPCGRCRQLLLEAAELSGVDLEVVCGNSDCSRLAVYRVSELLPDAFGPNDVLPGRVPTGSAKHDGE